MNTLATVLDSDSGRLLVEKYLRTRFLERRSYDTVMANAASAEKFTIPEKKGQYVEATRKGFFRMPQHVDLSNETADPASGATMAGVKVRLPMEFIHEFVPIGEIAAMTSWIDLQAWADEDLPLALMRRMHQLTQNALKVGRYTPGKWAADGSASVAFDTTPQATVTLHGVSFTFQQAVHYFVGMKAAHGALDPNDRANWRDLEIIKTRMANSGTPKLANGRYGLCLSEAMAMDLARDDEHWQAQLHAFGGQGLKEGKVMDYRGWAVTIDDEPFTEDWGDAHANVRASAGPIHTAFGWGKGAFAYVPLGGKSSAKPKFKVQDLTKTGLEKTIGYMIPFQVGVIDSTRCATYAAPVSAYEGNG